MDAVKIIEQALHDLEHDKCTLGEYEEKVAPFRDAVPLSVIEEIKAEIDSYYLDCDFSVYDKDENCKKCNDNVFNSIRNIIDRKIKEIQA